MTLPSPTQFPAQSYRKGVTDAVYADHSELLRDIVEIIRGEVAALGNEGVDYLQLDAPRYSYYVDPKWRAWLHAEMDVDPESLLTEALAADNTCLHACRRDRDGPRDPHSAAGTTAASGTPRAATTRSPSGSSTRSTSTGFCSNTTTPGRVRSSRCASFPRGRPSCSG